MRSYSTLMKSLVFAAAATLMMLLCAEAAALDGHQDRKGPFAGLGVGGGAAILGDEVGGEFMFDGQLGGGATKWLTFGLDVDARMQNVDGNTNWALVPGIESNIFLGESIFLRLGIGIGFFWPEDLGALSKDFTFAFNGGLGVGYEFFLSSNVALSLGVEADYFVIDDMDDLVTIGFVIGLRFY